MPAPVKTKDTSFNEKSDGPIATREMTKEEIEDFKRVLAKSYFGLDESNITWEFFKIPDNDTDCNDYIMLRYDMITINNGEKKKRTIYKLKLPLPESVKEKAQRMNEKTAREGGARKYRHRKVFAITDFEQPAQPVAQVVQATPVALPAPVQKVAALPAPRPSNKNSKPAAKTGPVLMH